MDFTGGEPLLRPGWERIAGRLAELHIRTKLLTNGLAVNPNTISQLRDVGVAGVGISIDGLEATHDYIRERPGLFRAAIAAIEQLHQADIPVTVITTVNGLNTRELPALERALHDVGVTYWQVQPLFPLGRGLTSQELQLSPQAYLGLGSFVQAHQDQPADAYPQLLPGDSFGYYTDFDRRDPPWLGCMAGIVSCGITSDGRIKGCLSMPDDLVEGDLRQHDLWDIWFHEDSFAYNRRFSRADLGTNCAACEHGQECRGGCSAMSYGRTGRLHNDPFCFLHIQEQARP